MRFLHSEIQEAVNQALTEDRTRYDVTTRALVQSELIGRAVIISKAHGVLAGIDTAKETFRQVDPSINFVAQKKDTAVLTPGTPNSAIDSNLIAKVNGPLASILTAERTALNFLQHLSGIASTTNKYVQAIQDHNCIILDTRKTIPGLRELQKYAVAVGGGKNHRKNLGDGVLIKDNHIKAAAIEGLSLAGVIERARERAPSNMKVEVEVETLEQVQDAVDVGADILLLDNMTLSQLDAAVSLVNGRAVTEASGSVTLANVADVAATGVDMISVGALTHSANALDISLDIVEIT